VRQDEDREAEAQGDARVAVEAAPGFAPWAAPVVVRAQPTQRKTKRNIAVNSPVTCLQRLCDLS